MKKFTLVIINLILFTPCLLAQFNRDNYLEYLPPSAKIICQTEASKNFYLYGNTEDTDYKDIQPVDGIDDNRAYRLKYLAAKFSPVLHKNNFSVPRDFEEMLTIRYDKHKKEMTFNKKAFLFIDTWDLTKPVSERLNSETIDLSLLSEAVKSYNCNDFEFKAHDDNLKNLLIEFHPDSLKIQKINPNQCLQKVLFFDFPGSDEKSWKNIYKKIDHKKSKIYAHFFIHEESKDCYEFIIQYWFFYPFNDGGNNHEGDWEHINVHVTTLDRKGNFLNDVDISKILDSQNEAIIDSLIIKKVDYYFHHFVTILDYQAINFLQDSKNFKISLQDVKGNRLLKNWIYQQIYYRIHLLKDALNTHPIGYIGADNMGLDQIFALPGGKNRNSHGTYPFPGIWKRIGPAGATERIYGEKKYKFILPTIKEPKTLGQLKMETFEYEIKEDPNYLTYNINDIILVPDWERVIDLAINNPKVRREWFWLILPIRWGFPVVKSPGAGVIKHADMGNASPVGPAYNSGWNRVAECRGYELYDPHVLPSQFLLGLQDNFHNSWGFFNLTLPTFISLPVTNVIWSFTGSHFQFNPKFFPRQELPFRFASIAYQPSYTITNNHFAYLLPREENPAIHSLIANNTGFTVNERTLKHQNYMSYIGFMFNIHLGRYASENKFSLSNSKLQYEIHDPTGKYIAIVKGNLKLYEFEGSLKHCFLKSNFQPFFRIGYGWTWYRVENMTLNDQAILPVKTQWFHNPTFPFLPNSGHIGCGFELFAQRNDGIRQIPVLEWLLLVGEPEFGIRLEYTFHFHKLGSDAPTNLWVNRHEFGAGIVIGF